MVRDLHRHAVEQASRRWRGGRDSAVAETSRDNFIFAQANAHRLQRFISELGAMEPAILADRRREAEREQRRFSRSHNGKTIPDGTENVTAASAPGLTNSDREKYYLRTLGISSLILCGNQILSTLPPRGPHYRRSIVSVSLLNGAELNKALSHNSQVI